MSPSCGWHHCKKGESKKPTKHRHSSPLRLNCGPSDQPPGVSATACLLRQIVNPNRPSSTLCCSSHTCYSSKKTERITSQEELLFMGVLLGNEKAGWLGVLIGGLSKLSNGPRWGADSSRAPAWQGSLLPLSRDTCLPWIYSFSCHLQFHAPRTAADGSSWGLAGGIASPRIFGARRWVSVFIAWLFKPYCFLGLSRQVSWAHFCHTM